MFPRQMRLSASATGLKISTGVPREVLPIDTTSPGSLSMHWYSSNTASPASLRFSSAECFLWHPRAKTMRMFEEGTPARRSLASRGGRTFADGMGRVMSLVMTATVSPGPDDPLQRRRADGGVHRRLENPRLVSRGGRIADAQDLDGNGVGNPGQDLLLAVLQLDLHGPSMPGRQSFMPSAGTGSPRTLSPSRGTSRPAPRRSGGDRRTG